MSAAKIAGILGIVVGLIQLLLGALVWMGLYVPWVGIHMLDGLLFTGIVAWVAVLANRNHLPKGRQALAWCWVVLLPVFGMTHAMILTGSLHWTIQVLHAAVGLVGIGIIRTTTDAVQEAQSRAT
jgi:hypothetical protein